MNTTMNPPSQTSPHHLGSYLAAGQRAFEHHAVKIAAIEQAGDLEAGSLVGALLDGVLDLEATVELITSGWNCKEGHEEIAARLKPLFP